MKNTSRTNLLLHVLMQVKRVEVHYLNDEYIPKIALLQAFWNANISAQSKGEKITKKKRHKTSLTDSHLQGSG